MSNAKVSWKIIAVSARTQICTPFTVTWDGREVVISGGWMSRITFLALDEEFARSESRILVKRSGYDLFSPPIG